LNPAKLFSYSALLLAIAAFLPPTQADEGRALFETHCAVCHDLTKATSQRLNRADWNWVMDDMVDYGMTWLTGDQRETVVDFLVENHGRD